MGRGDVGEGGRELVRLVVMLWMNHERCRGHIWGRVRDTNKGSIFPN